MRQNLLYSVIDLTFCTLCPDFLHLPPIIKDVSPLYVIGHLMPIFGNSPLPMRGGFLLKELEPRAVISIYADNVEG
jgi:hypothetical protein